MRLRFDECTFDSASRSVSRGGRRLDLTPKAFELLSVLLERRPEAVPRTALVDRVWPDTIVTHTALARVVCELREALGEERGSQKLIRTVHGFGYAFEGQAEPLDSPPAAAERSPRHRIEWAGRQVGLLEGESLVGRDAECALRLDEAKVSRRHARLVATADGVTIEDLGSKNGTWVAGRRINGQTPLQDGDTISIGSTRLVYHREGSARSTLTDSGPWRREGR